MQNLSDTLFPTRVLRWHMPLVIGRSASDYLRAQQLADVIMVELLQKSRDDRARFLKRFAEKHPGVGLFLGEILAQRGVL